MPAHTPAPACTPRCFGYRNHTPESPALPMQSPAVSRSRHLTVCDGVSVCGHASVSGRHASGLYIEYSFPIDTPPVGPRLDEVRTHTPAPACTPRCFGYRNHTPESPALPMQSPAASVSRSRHLTVCGGVSVCGHASVSGRHASGFCIEYSFSIATPPVGPRLDEMSAHTPARACTPRCFGYRNHTPESPALPIQSPAVSRSRHLTVCDGVSVCAIAIVCQDIRCFGYRNLTLETLSLIHI